MNAEGAWALGPKHVCWSGSPNHLTPLNPGWRVRGEWESPRARFVRAAASPEMQGAAGNSVAVACQPDLVSGSAVAVTPHYSAPARRSTAPSWSSSGFCPPIRRDYPLNLSISLSGGKETNKDSLSNGERTGKSSTLKSAGFPSRVVG